MQSRLGVATRRAIMLLPFLGSAAAAQSLGGLSLRGTGAGFDIADLATRSSSITISSFSELIEATVTNQTVVVRLNTLRHTWAGDLTARVSFVSAALGTTFNWTLLARPGLQTAPGGLGFSDDFNGNYSFGEFDEPSSLFTGDLIDYMALGPLTVLPSGDYFAFDGQNYGSPGAAFGGLNPNGVWTLSLIDAVGGDVGSIGSWDLAFNTAAPMNVVPEPSSVALMAAGLGALAVAARRRRSA